MTKTLTEKWKNGELPDGAYYILVDKYEQNEPEIDIGVCYNSNFQWWIVKEVLAPVPSYEEWKTAKENLEKNGTWYTERSHNELLKRIERLQEQIKKLQYYRDRAHKALCEISALSEKEMDSGKAWDIAHNAILCLNEISGV